MLQTLYSILVTKLYNHDVLPGEVGKLSRVSPLKKNMRARGAPDTTKARVGGWGMWRGEKNHVWSRSRMWCRVDGTCGGDGDQVEGVERDVGDGVGDRTSSWRTQSYQR